MKRTLDLSFFNSQNSHYWTTKLQQKNAIPSAEYGYHNYPLNVAMPLYSVWGAPRPGELNLRENTVEVHMHKIFKVKKEIQCHIYLWDKVQVSRLDRKYRGNIIFLQNAM